MEVEQPSHIHIKMNLGESEKAIKVLYCYSAKRPKAMSGIQVAARHSVGTLVFGAIFSLAAKIMLIMNRLLSSMSNYFLFFFLVERKK